MSFCAHSEASVNPMSARQYSLHDAYPSFAHSASASLVGDTHASWHAPVFGKGQAHTSAPSLLLGGGGAGVGAEVDGAGVGLVDDGTVVTAEVASSTMPIATSILGKVEGDSRPGKSGYVGKKLESGRGIVFSGTGAERRTWRDFKFVILPNSAGVAFFLATND